MFFVSEFNFTFVRGVMCPFGIWFLFVLQTQGPDQAKLLTPSLYNMIEDQLRDKKQTKIDT